MKHTPRAILRFSAVGDAVRPGLLTDAIGAGRVAAPDHRRSVEGR